MTIDIEERLRATYVAVAEQTRVTPVDPAWAATDQWDNSRGLDDARRRRRWPTLAAAAAVVLVVAGVALVNRPSAGPAASTIDELRAAVDRAALSLIPEGFGLVEIESLDDGGRLVFTDGERQLIVQTIIDAPVPAGDPVEVRGLAGRVRRDGDTTVLAWVERPGVTVEVIGVGEWTTGELIDIGNDVTMMTTPSWDLLTENSGFVEARLLEPGIEVAEYDPDFPGEGTSTLERRLVGSVQSGLGLEIGLTSGSISGFSTTYIGRTGDDTYVFVVSGDVHRVDLDLVGEVIASFEPVPDPASPDVRVASIDLGSLVPPRADGAASGVGVLARLLREDGTLISEEPIS
jgi:hypothetical protein